MSSSFLFHSSVLGLATTAVVLSSASLVVAQEAADPTAPVPVEEAPPQNEEPSEDAGKIHFAVQPLPTGDSRTFHRHDGFYLRANLGISQLWASLDDRGSQDFDVDVSGTAMGIDLLIGGTPSPGIAVGGGVLANWAFGADFEREGESIPDRDFQDLTLGAFVDGFPSATGPWHFGALVGVSGVAVNQDSYIQNTGGLGGAIWAGYDEWVAPDWAMGGQLRLNMSQTAGEENGFDVSASAFSLGLMFSVLYH